MNIICKNSSFNCLFVIKMILLFVYCLLLTPFNSCVAIKVKMDKVITRSCGTHCNYVWKYTKDTNLESFDSFQ